MRLVRAWSRYARPVLPEVEREVRRLGRELHGTLSQAGFSLKALSAELHYHPQYLSRAFRGAHPLKVEVAFLLLARCGVDPAAFFEGLYPFGGKGARKLANFRRPTGPAFDEVLSARREVQRRQLSARNMTPEAWSNRAGRVLRRMLQRRQVSQKGASVALGLGSATLGHALRGNTQLTFEHIFGTLRACGAPMGRFVLEWFGPPDEYLLEAREWLRALDAAEKVAPGMMMAYAKRRRLPEEEGEAGEK